MVEVLTIGIQGPAGAPGPQNLFIQPEAPITSQATYLWIQTGLGVGGTGITLWLEDGAP